MRYEMNYLEIPRKKYQRIRLAQFARLGVRPNISFAKYVGNSYNAPAFGLFGGVGILRRNSWRRAAIRRFVVRITNR